MTKRILGIDTGTNSLGWAVVDRHEDGTYTLIDRGDYLFQEGVKIKKGIESSKAAERSEHRASRKHYFRRRLRKIEALKVLVDNKLCPYIPEDALHEWHVHKKYPMIDEFLAWQRTDEESGRNPYTFRHICLHEKLDLNRESDRYILGRALYHLAQRRGFKSNRLDQSEDNKESGKVKQGISELSKAMEEAGFEYLGDYFYYLYSTHGNTVRIRNRYTDREEHYCREFYAICDKQELDKDLVRKLEKALYFQRPLKSQRQNVGKCTFEPSRQRCSDTHPAFERYRMLSLINNIKVTGPHDIDMRPLDSDEKSRALKCFFRKSKPQFEFEDIAKEIAGRGNYQYKNEEGNKPYKFNYRMTQSVSGCPTTTSLMDLFKDGGKDTYQPDYASMLAETYTMSSKTVGDTIVQKSPEEVVDDVWNVLYSFADKPHLKQWAIDKLQFDEATAEKFADIRISGSFASLSLCAIRKILPWLEQGYIYPHAVLFAKIPDIVGKTVWETRGEEIIQYVYSIIASADNFNGRDAAEVGIKEYLTNNFSISPGAAAKLYHPSMIEAYPDARKDDAGIYQLGSPQTNAVRNPMAMKSLHQLRKVINALLKKGVIDASTEVHVEYARELNDANRRKALAQWNKERESKRRQYAEEIRKLLNIEADRKIPDDDILKYELWEEQGHICLYTGNQIGICDFIGSNPSYDIEHTIPRSVGGDTTLENLTLCSSRYNRDVKKSMIPTQLPKADYDAIMTRLEPMKERIEKLRREIDRIRTNPVMSKDQKDSKIQSRHLKRIELDYLVGKYKRFQMTEVPEGFSRRQGAGIGLVGKYAGLYLQSLFSKRDEDGRRISNVRVVKGATTAEFRKMWGIQGIYEKKSRDNHSHHCIDAIVIACIDPGSYNETARYYQQLEEYERFKSNKPSFPKPWASFTEDIKALSDSLLVVHYNPDVLARRDGRKVKTANGVVKTNGDSVRGSLHADTYYGAIERDGEIRYVVRRPLSSFTSEKDLEAIVDDAVRDAIKKVVAEKGFKAAIEGDIYMNKEKGVKIKKVRCFAADVKNPVNIRTQRDASEKDYKRQFHVKNESNYLLAIYEGEVKGKIKRDFKLVQNIEAAKFFKRSGEDKRNCTIVPEMSPKGLHIKCKLKIGTHVLLYENKATEINFENTVDLCKRLYVVSGLSILRVNANSYGTITLKHHQEARMAKDIKISKGAFHIDDEYRPAIFMLHTQFNALVEGEDFIITALGEIKLLHDLC